jgi:hypothetical protein
MPTDFIGLFTLLASARVRFVVVGGLAVLLHGLDRLTADVDLAIDLSTDATQDAVRALTEGGYRPMAPVDPMSLADQDQRREWQTTRGMQVFSFWDTTNTHPTVDIMLAPVVSFEDLWAEAATVSIGGIDVRIASIAHLIKMTGNGRTHFQNRRGRAHGDVQGCTGVTRLLGGPRTWRTSSACARSC